VVLWLALAADGGSLKSPIVVDGGFVTVIIVAE
jgi:hypothetical protein